METKDILALNCKKHIKIFLLNSVGVNKKEIATLLKTNAGHVNNELKKYNNNKDRQLIAKGFSGYNTKDEVVRTQILTAAKKALHEIEEIDKDGYCTGECANISDSIKTQLSEKGIKSNNIDVGNNKLKSIFESDHSALYLPKEDLIIDTQVWQFNHHDGPEAPIEKRQFIFTQKEYGDLGFYFTEVKDNHKKAANGLLVGKSHEQGGIDIKTPEGKIEAQGGEVIINAEATKQNLELLSKINQSAGNGVAFTSDDKQAAKEQAAMVTARHGAKIGDDKLKQGIEIEKEHTDLYNELSRRLQAEGSKMPMTQDEFFTWIAKAHIKESPDYYELLKKYVENKAGYGKKISGLTHSEASKLWDYHERTGMLPPEISAEDWDKIKKGFNLKREYNETDPAGGSGLHSHASNGTKVNDISKKKYFLLTKEETIQERDRIEALREMMPSDAQRMKDLCRYSMTSFNTLLSKLK